MNAADSFSMERPQSFITCCIGVGRIAFVTEIDLRPTVLTEVSEQRAQQRRPPASRQSDDAEHFAAKSFDDTSVSFAPTARF